MAQWLRTLATYPEVQQLHGGLQPSVMKSDVLFLHTGDHADRALVHIKYTNKFFAHPFNFSIQEAEATGLLV